MRTDNKICASAFKIYSGMDVLNCNLIALPKRKNDMNVSK